jgi:tyrosine-protein phosphatase SIW14
MQFSGRGLPAHLAALLVTAALVSPAAAAEKAATTAVSARDVTSHIQIDNFGQVSPTYFRGAQPSADDFADLAALGVKMVIDLQADGDPGEKLIVERTGMKFYRIRMTTHQAPTADQVATFLGLVNAVENQPVYVHCAGGRHRTGVMTAIYRMSGDAWTADKAFAEMKQYRFGADFLHPEFKRFVYAYRPAGNAQPVAAVATAPIH